MSSRKNDEVADAASSEPVLQEAPAGSVRIHDKAGADLGFSINLKSDPVELDRADGETDAAFRIRRLAKSVSGWTAFSVDGERYAYSQARAADLFIRFPHFAAQVEQALSKDEK